MDEKIKLTITVSKKKLPGVKKFARENNTSLSSLIDQFLDSLLNAESQGRLHPLVAKLKGIIKHPGDDEELKQRSKRK